MRDAGGLEPFERSLAGRLLRALGDIQADIRAIVSERGLTEHQWRVVSELAAGGGVSIGDLARATLMEAPVVVGVVDRLERSGVVQRERSAADRRRVNVSLTSLGEKLAVELGPVIASTLHRVESRLTDEERATLFAALDSVSASAAIDTLQSGLKSETVRSTSSQIQAGLIVSLEEVARAVPDEIAVVDDKVELTWFELDRQASCFARGVRGLGVEAGEAVAVYMGNNVMFFVVVLGLAKAGAVPVLLDPRSHERDAEALVQMAGAGVVVDDRGRFAPGGDVRLLISDSGVTSIEALVEANTPLRRSRKGTEGSVVVFNHAARHDAKAVVFPDSHLVRAAARTFGTLGVSVPNSLDELRRRSRSLATERSRPVVAVAAPLGRTFGFSISLISMLLGGAVVIGEEMSSDAAELAARIERNQATWLALGGSTVAKALTSELERAADVRRPYDVSRLRLVVSSGSRWPAASKTRLLNHGKFVIIDNLATTETGDIAMSMTTNESAKQPNQFVALPQVALMDGSQIVEWKPGAEGEAIVFDPPASGYRGAPQAEREIFIEVDGRRAARTGTRLRVEHDRNVSIMS